MGDIRISVDAGNSTELGLHAWTNACTGLNCVCMMMYCAGGAITDLAAVQTGLTTVQVTWTAPPGPPAGGYQITVDEASISNVNHPESPFNFTTSELGVHTVQVIPSTGHFPEQAVLVSVMVTVEGEGEAFYIKFHDTAYDIQQVLEKQMLQHHH